MAKNYRDIYEDFYGVRLRCGVSSIHHVDFSHSNSQPKNLVAITQDLHNQLNITVEKFPKLLRILLRCQVYWLIKNKNLLELEEHIQVYLTLNKFIQLRNTIKKYGIDRTVELYGYDLVNEIYDLERMKKEKEFGIKERTICA